MIYDIVGDTAGPGGRGIPPAQAGKNEKKLKKMLFSVFFLKSKDIYIGQEKMLANPNQSPTKSLPTPISGMGGEGLSAGPGGSKEGNQKLT